MIKVKQLLHPLLSFDVVVGTQVLRPDERTDELRGETDDAFEREKRR
jgi:hypothetical protein